MRHWTLSAAIGAAVLISGSGSASPAQGVVSGNYVKDGERSDDVYQAIESAIAGLPSEARPLARMRLRKSTGATSAGSIRISIWADRFSIKYDAYPLVAVFIGGEPIKWKLVEELVFDVSAKANGEAISLTFRADDSERTVVYRSVGQQLVAETIIASPQFSTPLRYTIVYNRAN